MLVLKNLLRRKVRTLLSILGISIGVAAIIAFNAIGQGFKRSLDRYMKDTGAELVVVNRMMQDPAFSRVKKEEQDFVRALPEVEHLSLGTFTFASPRGLKVKSKGAMPALLIFGRTPGDRILDKFKKTVKGRVIEREGEIMVGSIAAENFGIRVDDTLELFDQPFKVVGIHESSVPFEKVGAIVSNSVVQKQVNMGESCAMAWVYVKPGADWSKVKEAVETRFTQLHAMRTEEFTNFYNQLEYIDWFVWVISLVSVAVGALGVLNTMLMSVSERTREIGTLRAVGWRQAMVLHLILSEGVTISVVGGLAGLGAGTAGAEALIRLAPSGFLTTHYTPQLYAIAMLVAVGLGFVGALYPAVRASRLSPIEALKYE